MSINLSLYRFDNQIYVYNLLPICAVVEGAQLVAAGSAKNGRRGGLQLQRVSSPGPGHQHHSSDNNRQDLLLLPQLHSDDVLG